MSFVVHELYLNYKYIFKKIQAKVIQLLSKNADANITSDIKHTEKEKKNLTIKGRP